MTLLYTLCAFAICHTVMFLTFQKKNPEIVNGLRLWFAMKFQKLELDGKQAEAIAEHEKQLSLNNADNDKTIQRHPTEEEIKRAIREAEKTIREAEATRTISLHVGDRYFCQLNKSEMDEIGTYAAWKSTNAFIADLPSDGGTLTARHIGTCDIESGCEGQRHLIYKVKVNETSPDWFASDMFRFIALQRTEMNALRTLANQRWSYYMDLTDKGVAIYTGNERISRIKYQYDSNGTLMRVLYEINPSDGYIEEIEKQMDERMERIRTANKDTRYWYYTRDEDQEFTNCIAFAKMSRFGTILLGIGRNWREGCSENEVKRNAVMIEATFKDLTDPKDHPSVIGKELKDGGTEEQTRIPENERNKENEKAEAESGSNYFADEWEQLKKEQEEADELQKKIEERRKLNKKRKELEERKRKQREELDILDGKTEKKETKQQDLMPSGEPEATSPEDELIKQREQLESDKMELRKKKELFEEQKKFAGEIKKYKEEAEKLRKEMNELQNQLSIGMAGVMTGSPTPLSPKNLTTEEPASSTNNMKTETDTGKMPATETERNKEKKEETTGKQSGATEPPAGAKDEESAAADNKQGTTDKRTARTSDNGTDGADKNHETDSDAFDPSKEGSMDDNEHNEDNDPLLSDEANREGETEISDEEIEDELDPTSDEYKYQDQPDD